MCQSLSQPLKKTNRPVELGFHGKRGREQDGDRDKHTGCPWQRKAQMTDSLGDTGSGYTSALRVHFISSVGVILPPGGKSRRRRSKGAQTSFSRPLFLPGRIIGPGHLQPGTKPLPQTHVRRRCHQCPLVTQLPILTFHNKLQLRNVHLQFTQQV